jgi:hypothetical protein
MVNWLEFGQLVRVAILMQMQMEMEMEMKMRGRSGSEALVETANCMCRELEDSYISTFQNRAELLSRLTEHRPMQDQALQ